ncbi:unnamed protein product [Adineta steineri]|nr:unnamed protein product [Adineta steineri]
MNKEQQSGQTDKSKALRNVLRSYRWTPHASTGSSPAEMMLKHSIRTELHRLKPHESTVPQQTTKFKNGQLVWTSTRQTNKRSQWQPGIIITILGSMNYEIQLNDGQRCKRHQNQLRLRYSSTDQSSDVDSLPDDLLDNMLQSKSTQSSISTQPSKSTSPRYPRRIRRPPERFSPS